MKENHNLACVNRSSCISNLCYLMQNYRYKQIYVHIYRRRHVCMFNKIYYKKYFCENIFAKSADISISTYKEKSRFIKLQDMYVCVYV